MAYTTIKKPSDYFNTVLYTGDGTSSNAITGVGFQPDFLWIKERNNTRGHQLMDVVRGASLRLQTSNTNADSASALNSFDSDGFDVNGSTLNGTNFNTGTYAAWNWLADNTSGSSNTQGDITSTVSANTTSGFSIVSYTGNGSGSATVGHGLGVIPSTVIIKARTSGSANGYWYVKHKSLTSNYNIYLNVTDAASNVTSFSQGGIGDLDNANTFDFASGTSGVNTVNASGTDFIAYCFAEKQGFSKFGSYTGNGSTDGTFVYTGFKPAFVMVKRTDTTGNWVMVDSKRDTFNVCDAVVSADISDAEYDVDVEDFLSNGFKMRDAHTTRNASGGTYIYMAFAEEPLVGDNPATAR